MGSLAKIGDYEVQVELGRGTFGRVYRAYDPKVRRYAAIKIFASDDEPELLRRFLAEAGTTGNLNHKNIVTVYGSGEHEGRPYIVMELLEGVTFQQLLIDKTPLSTFEKVRLMQQIADGLRYAHKQKVVHRDIKPSNIMLTTEGIAKVLDFGIARAARDTMTRSRSGEFVGTPAYMAPEQFRNEGTDKRADIFSYGVVYYAMMAGKHPFPAEDLATLSYLITQTDAPPVADAAPECPARLAAIIDRCLARDRELRYQNFDDVYFAAQPVLFDLQKRRAAVLLTEVPPLILAGHVEAADEKLRDVLELDGANEEARSLRESIQDDLKRRSIRSQVQLLVHQGNAYFDAGRFSDAIRVYESALRLDNSDSVLGERLAAARAKLESNRKAARLLALARADADRGKLDRALEQANAALELDPDSAEGRRFADTIRTRIEEERIRKVQAALERADQQRRDEDFDGASASLDEAAKLDPGSPAVASARIRLETERARSLRAKREEQFRARMDGAQSALASARFDDAAQALETIAGEYPERTEASDLLRQVKDLIAAQKRSEAVAEAAREARALLKSRQFEDARQALDRVLELYPDEAGLLLLRQTIASTKATYERAREIEECIRRAEASRNDGNLEEALQTLRSASRKFKDDTTLVRLCREVEAEIAERELALRKDAMNHAREMIAAGQPDQAVEIVERLLQRGTKDGELALLAESAYAAKAACRRQKIIDDLAARVAALGADEEWPAALRLIEDAARDCPGDAEFAAALTGLRLSVAELQRKRLISEREQEIRTNIRKGEWNRAGLNCETACREFPQEDVFRTLDSQIQSGKRRSELDRLATTVKTSLEGQDIDRASRALDATTDMADTQEWRTLKREVDQARVCAACDAAEGHLRNGDLERAGQELQRARELEVEDRRTHDIGNRLAAERARRRETERQASLDCMERGQFDESLARLDALRQDFPEDRRLQADVALVRRRRWEAGIDAALARQDWSKAEAELGNASRDLPSEDWRETADRIRAARRKSDEAERLRKYVSRLGDAQAARLRGDLALAADILRQLAGENPPDERAAACLHEVIAERKAALATDIEHIDAAIFRRDWSGAEVAILHAREQFGQDAALDEAAQRLREARQNADFEILARNILTSIRRNKFSAASRQLDLIRRHLADRPEWLEIQEHLRKRNASGAESLFREVLRETGRSIEIGPMQHRRAYHGALGAIAAVIGIALTVWVYNRPPVVPEPEVTLRPEPGELSFGAIAAGAPLDSMTIEWGRVEMAYEAFAEHPWITVEPRAGETLTSLKVSAKSDGLSPGTHRSAVVIVPRSKARVSGVARIPVTVEVVGAQEASRDDATVDATPRAPVLLVDREELFFEFRIGEPAPPPSRVNVVEGSVARVDVVGRADWLKVNNRRRYVAVAIAPNRLSPGTHDSILLFRPAPGAAPRRVAVRVVVSPPQPATRETKVDPPPVSSAKPPQDPPPPGYRPLDIVIRNKSNREVTEIKVTWTIRAPDVFDSGGQLTWIGTLPPGASVTINGETRTADRGRVAAGSQRIPRVAVTPRIAEPAGVVEIAHFEPARQ